MQRLPYLIDTNILLRLTNPQSKEHEVCRDAIRRLQRQDSQLVYTLQNAAEYWNVSTRPVERNGHGLSTSSAAQGLSLIEQTDDLRVYTTWRQLIVEHDVQGVQVHDAKLAAAMLAHNVPRILTFNTNDFARYAEIEAIHPENLKRDYAN